MKKETLQLHIDRTAKNVLALTDKLLADFKYSYEWGVANQLYSESYTLEVLKRIQDQWNATDETDEVFLKRFKSQLIDELINTSPVGNSTNDASNSAKRLRIEATQKLVNHYGIFSSVE